MKKHTRSTLALILSLVLCLNMCIPVLAANTKGITFSATLSQSEITAEEDKTVVMTISMSAADKLTAMTYAITCDKTGTTFGDATAPSDGIPAWNSDEGIMSWMGTVTYTGTELGTVEINVPKDTPAGQYTFTVNITNLTDEDYTKWETAGVATATLTITDAPASDYEIWYKLDSDADADSDNYADYDIDNKKQVTATVYIKSNNADVTLQAYDIYLTYGPNLSYNSETMEGVAYVDGEDVNTPADKGDTVTHIQLAAKEKSYTLTKGTAVELGTIVFDIVDTVQYGAELKITLTPGSAEQGENCTNIAVGADEKAYYPSTTQTLKGAEVSTTYTVTYNANTTDTVTGMPTENGVKQYNVDMALSDAQPTRTGYTFKGWSTTEGADNSEGKVTTYTENADETLYAIWEQNKVTVTFNMNGHGTQIAAESVTPGEKVTKPTDPTETGYTFKGWYSESTLTNEYSFDSAVNSDITLYAKWEINQYTITFANTGDTTVQPITQDYGTAITAPANPTKTGYTFAGWDKDIPTTMPAEDMTITASWTANKVNVTLNANDGKIDNADTKVVEETYDSAYANLTDPTRVGYKFNGWYTAADNSGTKVESTTKVTNASEHTLYAHWKPITYTVQFNPGNGGTGTTYTQNFTYDVEQALTAMTGFTATDSNFVFDGWAETEGGEVKYADKTAVKNLTAENGATVNLYAVWKQDVYQITYNSNPENINMSTTGLLTTYSSAEGATITTEPTATGYTFTKWTTTTEGVTISDDGKTVTIPKNHTGAVVLTAEFTINQYTITFENTGDTTIQPITQNYGTKVTAPADPTKTGYSFNGWNPAIPSTMPAENKTITAQWTIKQYTITFDSDGGTAVTAITQDYNSVVTKPGDPTKLGYTFAGWDINNDGKYDGSDVFYTTMPDEDKTVKAIWTENTYSITYNKPDGVDFADTVVDKTDVKYTDSVTLPSATEVTKPGYTLVGFTQTENGTTADEGYTPGAKVSKMTATNGGSVTLYPVFTEAEYTLSFDLGDHVATDATKPEDIKVKYNGTYSNLPADATPAPGYKFIGWYIGDTKIESSSTVTITADSTATAKYEAIKYTITFVVPSGDAINSVEYTIESDYTLPTATHSNSLYSFKNWKVTTTVDGSTVWAQAAEINANTSVTGKYGNVTLTAQWNEVLSYVVEEYKYAADGYVLLMIATDSNTNAYTFGGETMYFIDDANYRVNGKSVFYTLIPTKDGDTALVDSNMKLTEAGMAKLQPGTAAAPTITYNGDINGDGYVNIADANIVYQIVQATGSYYSTTQLTTAQRLAADMDRATSQVTKRGSIADVNAIINIINNVASN